MNVLFSIILAAAGAAASEEATLPLGVEQALKRVDDFDPRVKQKAYERLRAEVTLRRARWDRVNGQVGLQAQETVSKGGIAPTRPLPAGTGTFGDQFTGNLFAQLSFPVYAGGAISGAIDAAEARAKAATFDLAQVTRDLKRAALIAYAQLLGASAQREISRRGLERAELLVGLAEKKRASGIGTEADVARAKLSRLRQQEDVEQRTADRLVALAVLKAALLLDAADIEPSDDFSTLFTRHAQELARERPEVLSLEAQRDAANADRAVAFAGYLPRLELFMNANYGNGSTLFFSGLPLTLGGGATDRFGIFSGSVNAGVLLKWTGWDFFVTRDKVAQADASAAALSAQVDDQRRVVRQQIEVASAQEAQAARRLEALAGGKETAALAIKLARARYETGNAILTEVLDAEIEAIGIENRQIQAAYDRAVAHLDRLRAEGKEL